MYLIESNLKILIRRTLDDLFYVWFVNARKKERKQHDVIKLL
jgi:hypothetical protein